MALTKVSTGMLSADLASVDLNIDANTLYIDVSNNRVGINNTGPATALDVTGTVTADGLTVDGDALFTTNTATNPFVVSRIGNTTESLQITFDDANAILTSEQDEAGRYGGYVFNSKNDGTTVKRMEIAHTTGDISFYEDTGTTPKFFWDASAESLSITGNANVWTIDNTTIYGNRAGGSIYVGNTDATGEFGITSGGSVAMQFDANGNVGIGDTNPANGYLTIRGATTTGTKNGHIMLTGDSATNGQGPQIVFSESGISSNYAGASVGYVRTGSNGIGDLVFGTRGTAGDADTVASERMRIDSSGNLLVGKTAADGGVNGGEIRSNGETYLTATSAQPLALNRKSTDGAIATFAKDNTTVGSIRTISGDSIGIGTGVAGLRFINGTNRIQPVDMSTGLNSDTLTSLGDTNKRFKDLYLSGVAYAGELIVGNTVVPSASAGGAAFDPNTNGRAILKLGTTSTANQGLAEFFNPNGQVGGITTNGSATAYNTSSDQRLKENIADADDAGSKIDAIQVRKFDWKADGSHQDYGMVAQELQTVAPEAVSAPDDPEEMMGVDYSKLVPMMLKEIQSLRARVAQLES